MQLSVNDKEISTFLMVGDKVLIKPRNPQGQTKTGLLLPPSVQNGEKLQCGYIVRIGPGYPIPSQADEDEFWKKQENKYLPLQAQEGDLAVYLQSSVYEIILNDEVYAILPHAAILMLVRDENLFE